MIGRRMKECFVNVSNVCNRPGDSVTFLQPILALNNFGNYDRLGGIDNEIANQLAQKPGGGL